MTLSDELQHTLKRRLIAMHLEATSRDPRLCMFSKDGRFCPNTKIYPDFEQVVNLSEPTPESRVGLHSEVVCFCKEHQGCLRYALVAFADEERAEGFARNKRDQGFNANIWQGKYVIIGPTNLPTLQLSAGHCVGHFEAQMYEDVIMSAIEHLKIDISRIIGRGSNQ